MRSGDPGPDRPRARRESPDLAIFATRTVPARGGRDAALLLRPFPSRTRCGSLGGFLFWLLGDAHFFFGLNLPCRQVPILLLPAVRVPPGSPKQRGALRGTLFLSTNH